MGLNKEAKRIYDLNYTKINAEKIKVVKKEWRDKNRKKIREWKLKWATSEKGKASAKRWRDKSPKSLFNLYKASAKRRQIPFEISLELFSELIKMDCAYCGQSSDVKRNGIDRVENEKGYMIDNVISCCTKCNQMKGKLFEGGFFSHIIKIIEYGA